MSNDTFAANPADIERLANNVRAQDAERKARLQNLLAKNPISEGTLSAQRLEAITRHRMARQDNGSGNVYPFPATALHRVNTITLPHGSCTAVGNHTATMHTGKTASVTASNAQNPNCAPGMCEFKATCGDTQCHGHPANTATHSNADPIARARFWRAYLGGWAVLALLIAALLISIKP